MRKTLMSLVTLFTVSTSVFHTCASRKFEGYPEVRGETKVGGFRIPCGRRFFTGSTRSASVTAPIVGGTDAEPGEFPFIVSITHGSTNTHFCGGSLVSPQHVLTAAHCLQRPRANLKVHVREYNIRSAELPPSEPIDVRTFVLHPDWNPQTLRHDLAIMTLERPVQLDNFAQPICMPCCPARSRGSIDYMVGQNLTTAGWGATKEGGKMSSILQKVNVPVIDHKTCKTTLFPQFFITETHLCAGYDAGGRDACQGDSGGPLFREANGFMTLEGIVSAGIGCARVGLPGVYTRVSEYVPWITDSISTVATSQPSTPITSPQLAEQSSKTESTNEIQAFFGGGANPGAAALSAQRPHFLFDLLNIFG